MAKRFFYVCAGLFLLALSYHLGARSASAQAPSNSVVAMAYEATTLTLYVVTANGDVYYKSNGCWRRPDCWNIFGAPTPAANSTWGQVKDRYKR